MWWKDQRLISLRAIRLSAPYFAISVILGVITIGFQHANAIAAEKILVGDYWSRTATAGMAILFYFTKSVLPIGLNVIYPRWEVDPPKWWQFIPWPILIASFFYLWSKRATWGKHALLGLGFFVINLIPVLGFVVMSYMRITWTADHFVYISVIGIVGLMAAGGGRLYETLQVNYRPALVMTCSVLVAITTLFAHGYAGIFLNEDTLWTYTLKRNPEAWQAHNRLGAKKFARGEVDAALFHFQNSSRLRPDLGETYNNLGATLMQLNRKEEAIVAFEKALKATPHILATQANLANAYAQVGRWEDSARMFRDLVSEKKQPNNPVFQGNLGAVLLQLGNREEAIYHLRRAYELNPNLQGLKENLDRAGAPVSGASSGGPMQLKLE
jgi:tetratricopeptide (TPR) repeat protein